MPAVMPTPLRAVRALKRASLGGAAAVPVLAYAHPAQSVVATAGHHGRLFERFLPPDALLEAAAPRYRRGFDEQFRAKIEQCPGLVSRHAVDANGNSLCRMLSAKNTA